MRAWFPWRVCQRGLLSAMLACAACVAGSGPTGPVAGAEGAPSPVVAPSPLSMPASDAADLPAAPDASMPMPPTPAPAAPAAPVAPVAPVTAQPRGPLVDPERWQQMAVGDDPFQDRPQTVVCTEAMAEVLSGEIAFSVDTGGCNYITAEQPSLRAVSAGERLKVRLWHFALSAPEPAQAHAAVWLGGQPLLDERIPIPAEGGLIVRELVAPAAVPAGAPVLFHLHNHGENSWSLVEVSAGP